MSNVEQVKAQMAAYDMPPLPDGHPIFDGKYHRFGPKKKGWYILRELPLRSGRVVVTGAFGFFQGEERNTVPIKVDAEAMSDEDRSEYLRQQRAAEQAEEEKREQEQRLAANRARDQWSKAVDAAVGEHPYLQRKQVPAEGLRVLGNKLLIPLVRDGQLRALQKIDPDGTKLLNKGADAIGVMHVLGKLDGAPIIAVGEGYATCASARLSVAPGYDLPVVVALNAGNLIHVAKWLRKHYPDAHLLFLADDDYLLIQRFTECLRERFKVTVPVPVDGATHKVLAEDGAEVEVMAGWREDAGGVPFIHADIRKGRAIATPTFTNAGVASASAAARAVGNASVAVPLFGVDRAGRKITDFNDLQIEEGLDKVAAQVGAALLAAQQRISCSSSPQPEAAELPAPPGAPLPDAAQQRHSSPAPSHVGAVPESGPDEPEQARPAIPPAPLGEEEPREGAKRALAAANAGGEGTVLENVFSLEWALGHCALVQGSTDVWDSVNKLRMKRAAFIEMLGKENAKAWSTHPARRTISPRNLPRTVRGVAVDEGGGGGDNIVMMLNRTRSGLGVPNVWPFSSA